MCCIFNFMQYIFSFLHKAITAMLTCILACTVCFVMLFAVTAGIALGYNYSVSEYMEHKDTNVSVQLQRGIFTEKEGAGRPNFRRSAGDSDGGEIGEKLDSEYNYPKSSLLSRIQSLDAAENYERKLEELTSENYLNFQPLIKYGTVNLDQLSTDQPHVSIASTPNADFASEATAENIESKKESIELMRTLIDILKGGPAKDAIKVINEKVAKNAFEQIAPNVNNYRMPIDLAMAANATTTTEEFDIGLDITPLDIEIRSSLSSTESTKVLLFSEHTTPASVASSKSDDSFSDSDDVSSDWTQKLYAAVARLKRKDADTKTPTRNKPNTKTKHMKSLFQDPSFVAGIKSIDIVPYSVLQNEMSDQNGGLDQIKTNSMKDEKDKHSKSQSEVHVHKKIERTTSLNQDSYDDYGPAPSDEDYNYDDEKPVQIAVRRKRSAPRLLSKHSNKSRILTTLINIIS